MIGTWISLIALATILVVTVLVSNQAVRYRQEAEQHIRDVVDQINTSQQYTYAFDKQQENRLKSLEQTIAGIKGNFVTQDEISGLLKASDIGDSLETKYIFAESNINIGGRAYIQGATLGSNTHIPWEDGNTYIRSDNDKTVFIGDSLTKNIQIGDSNGSYEIRMGKKTYIPHSDGNIYLRPSTSSGQVIVGDVDTKQVRIGPNSLLPDEAGNVYIRPGMNNKDIYIGDTGTKDMQFGSLAGTTQVRLGPYTYLPHLDGNAYIRPGLSGKNVVVGDIGTNQVSIGGKTAEVKLGLNTYIPNSNGDIYLGPNTEHGTVNIGDTWTDEVNIGSLGTKVYTRGDNHYVKNYIDAWDKWGTSGRTLFAGWNSDKVVLGNNSDGDALTYTKNIPKNSVVSANNMYINGEATASKAVCVNETCLNENDLKAIKMLSKTAFDTMGKKIIRRSSA